MAEYPVGSVTRNGVTVEMRVDDTGTWKADIGRDYLRYDTRDKLVGGIDRVTKKLAKQVRVPFSRVAASQSTGEIRVKHGAVTGVHAGNGNLMVTWADGKKEQMAREYGHEDLAPLSPGEIKTLAELTKAATQARNAREEFVGARSIRLRDLTEKALESGE